MEVFPSYLQNVETDIKNFCSQVLDKKCLKNLSILQPPKFRYLLSQMKFMLAVGNPFSPTSIIEALSSNCIVIIEKNQISDDLTESPNVIIYEKEKDNSIPYIIEMIKLIESGERKFVPDDNCLKKYTIESMRDQVASLFEL